jgi:hypothetical protein
MIKKKRKGEVDCFFILIAINLILYLASAFSFYHENIKKAVLYGVLALFFSYFTVIYYDKKRRKRQKKNGEEKSSWSECGDCGNGVDADMDSKDGFDCIDIECGKMECFELDCDGVECGGVDCNF